MRLSVGKMKRLAPRPLPFDHDLAAPVSLAQRHLSACMSRFACSVRSDKLLVQMHGQPRFEDLGPREMMETNRRVSEASTQRCPRCKPLGVLNFFPSMELCMA